MFSFNAWHQCIQFMLVELFEINLVFITFLNDFVDTIYSKKNIYDTIEIVEINSQNMQHHHHRHHIALQTHEFLVTKIISNQNWFFFRFLLKSNLIFCIRLLDFVVQSFQMKKTKTTEFFYFWWCMLFIDSF